MDVVEAVAGGVLGGCTDDAVEGGGGDGEGATGAVGEIGLLPLPDGWNARNASSISDSVADSASSASCFSSSAFFLRFGCAGSSSPPPSTCPLPGNFFLLLLGFRFGFADASPPACVASSAPFSTPSSCCSFVSSAFFVVRLRFLGVVVMLSLRSVCRTPCFSSSLLAAFLCSLSLSSFFSALFFLLFSLLSALSSSSVGPAILTKVPPQLSWCCLNQLSYRPGLRFIERLTLPKLTRDTAHTLQPSAPDDSTCRPAASVARCDTHCN